MFEHSNWLRLQKTLIMNKKNKNSADGKYYLIDLFALGRLIYFSEIMNQINAYSTPNADPALPKLHNINEQMIATERNSTSYSTQNLNANYGKITELMVKYREKESEKIGFGASTIESRVQEVLQMAMKMMQDIDPFDHSVDVQSFEERLVQITQGFPRLRRGRMVLV